MSLQNKVINLIVLVILVYAAADYGVQRLFILPSFADLEHEETLKNMDRVVQAINREIQLLGTKANDWGSWDDTYKYMEDQNDAYQKSNLHQDSLKNLKITSMHIFDSHRQPQWGLIYDSNEQQEVELPQLGADLTASLSAAPDYTKEGLLVTRLGPLMIASRPILPGTGEGEPRGAMIFGQLLDAKGIAGQTKVSLSVTTISGGTTTSATSSIVNELLAAGPEATIIRTSGAVNQVYRVLTDLFGKPALLLEVEVPKAITARGEKAVNYAMISLFVAGFSVLVTLVLGLRWMVLRPLSLLTAHAISIGQSNDLSVRLELNRDDELGDLSKQINRMVERLQEARETLAEQSFSSGVAEMARGVLHNIGNAITPLNVKLSSLKNEFRQAPLAEIEMATSELADPSTPAARRADLSQFMELAGMELGALVKQATIDLDGIHSQVDHVQLILADQQRFSNAQRVMQSLDLALLVKESINLLPDSFRNSLEIEQEPGVAKIGKVQGARIALQQVLGNLLLNAAESIRASRNRDKGRIRISGVEEICDGVPTAHLRIEDNGSGIAADKLPRIFERGFSTKNRGSGVGLHWSANTIVALKGQIYAESEGEGRGAVFHLLLPLVHDSVTQ